MEKSLHEFRAEPGAERSLITRLGKSSIRELWNGASWQALSSEDGEETERKGTKATAIKLLKGIMATVNYSDSQPPPRDRTHSVQFGDIIRGSQRIVLLIL